MATFYCTEHHFYRRSFVIRVKKVTSECTFSSEHRKLEKLQKVIFI